MPQHFNMVHMIYFTLLLCLRAQCFGSGMPFVSLFLFKVAYIYVCVSVILCSIVFCGFCLKQSFFYVRSSDWPPFLVRIKYPFAHIKKELFGSEENVLQYLNVAYSSSIYINIAYSVNVVFA